MNRPPPKRDEELRAAYGEWSRPPEEPGRAGCPEPENILRLVEGTGSEEERLPILDHVMQCQACRREFDVLRALQEASPRKRQGIPPWMSLAASVVLLCGIGYGVWAYGGRAPISRFRGSEGDLQLLYPQAGATEGDTLTFIWSSRAGAVGYTLEILDGDGRTLYSREVGDTVVTLNRSTLPALEGDLTWWVRARGADGVERGSELRSLLLPGGGPLP